MSKSRLPQRDASLHAGGSMWISGRPPTGRTRTRSLEMSVTLGATTTWTSWCSRSQTTLRIWLAELSAPPAKNTTSAPESQYDRGRLVGVAEDRHAEAGLLGEVVRGRRAAHHLVAQPGLALQHAGDLVDVGRGPGDQHPMAEGAPPARGVQRPPQQPAADQQQRQGQAEHQHEEAAAQIGLDDVAADADQRRGDQSAVGDPLELVGAVAEHAPLVGAEEQRARAASRRR